MAVETTGVKVEWMDPVYRITFKGWFGEKTEVVLSTADVEDLVDAIQDLKQAFGKKSNRMSMLSQLGIKNKLLSAIALVDQAADEIDGEKQEQLKRISSVLFDINYDI
ncbi:hypothetical protein GCM10007416_34230 [Kroppenstedtia guangzhouensis]|uniref:Phage tail assembly chaperone protein, TAC n=1 Tax=Kroppenstedtia guangzhouensis TaxID=1274356 RepID=A0ABQ1H439_9BACL|nr:hypothetical protein [Kroppenstedtia guangzhouensis]GGA58179.1 hypothetical protein GCM10007416_34230 [Kroppenstedtia guangzhouensis]